LKALLYADIFEETVLVCSAVGVITNKQCCLKIWRGLNCVLTVEPAVTANEIVTLALPLVFDYGKGFGRLFGNSFYAV